MKVLVTGAAGFLGRSVVSRLLRGGTDVCCLVRPGTDIGPLNAIVEGSGPPWLTFARGTLASLKDDPGSIDGCDTVFHIAAAMTGSTASLFMNNVIGTRILLEQCARCGVRRVVLVSSMGVHSGEGLDRGRLVDETTPIDSKPHLRDPYTFSKVVEEREARDVALQHGLGMVTIRPGVIYGPGRDCITSRVGLKFGKFLLRMGGSRQLPYTYVDNCADAILLAGTTPGVDGEVFNVVDDNPPTPGQLLAMCRRSVGRVPTFRIPHCAIGLVSRACERYHRYSGGQLPAVLTPYKSRAMWSNVRYSNAKAKQLLHWEPTVTFEEGLSRTFAWIKADAA